MRSSGLHSTVYSDYLNQLHGVRNFCKQQITNSSLCNQDISTLSFSAKTRSPPGAIDTRAQNTKTRRERVQSLDTWNSTSKACRERAYTMRESPKFASRDKNYLSAKMQAAFVTLRNKIKNITPSGSPTTVTITPRTPRTPKAQKDSKEHNNAPGPVVRQSSQTKILLSRLELMKTTLSGWPSGNGSRPTSPEAHGIETPCLDAYNVHHPVNSVKKWSKKASDGTENWPNLAELIVADVIAISDLEPTKSHEDKSCTPYLVVKVEKSMRKTRKLPSTQASKFEERFVFLSMPRPDSHDKELMSVAVMDGNGAEAGKQIGQVYIDLCVAQDESFAGWYTFTNADHTHCGSVYIVFRRLPIRTAMTLAAAQRLASIERSLSSTDREDYHSILPDVWSPNTDYFAFHDEAQSYTSSPSGSSLWPLDELKRRLTWGRIGDLEAKTEQSRRNIF